MRPLHRAIAGYYAGRLARFGATPLGVDWTCMPTQHLRHLQLLRLCDTTAPATVNDLGCGYGALLELLEDRHPGWAVDYCGVDVAAAMVRAARRRWRGRPATRFATGAAPPRGADYGLASGIFNVRLDHDLIVWEAMVAATLAALARTSRRGFAVNLLLPPAKPGLYAAPPERWAAHCRDRLGLVVEVVAGYGLPEATLIARVPPG
ncbi:hypothetical protein CKO45_06930 [Paracraurococcus ruber]|uniref:Methyltransferase domain-containing protein n=1 Tax=Paracraurococcus ruber TaxID=77675 RepID=A0ABS1CUD7_9PROT|nr:hypothetical protein [Paracraurococcus ruber]